MMGTCRPVPQLKKERIEAIFGMWFSKLRSKVCQAAWTWPKPRKTVAASKHRWRRPESDENRPPSQDGNAWRRMEPLSNLISATNGDISLGGGYDMRSARQHFRARSQPPDRRRAHRHGGSRIGSKNPSCTEDDAFDRPGGWASICNSKSISSKRQDNRWPEEWFCRRIGAGTRHGRTCGSEAEVGTAG